MGGLTEEEFEMLPAWQKAHYLEHGNKGDYKVVDGKLCYRDYNPRITWKRFKALLDTQKEEMAAMAKADGGPYVKVWSDYGDWNPAGRPYTSWGFEYRLTVDVSYTDYSKKDEEAEKDIVREWLLAHGADEYELGSIYWNWHGYGAKYVCRFTECPHECLPPKMLRWLKKNPQWEHKVLGKYKTLADMEAAEKQGTFNF